MEEPQSPVPQNNEAPGSLAKTQILCLDSNVGALLSYLPILPVNVILALIWFFTEPKTNVYLRFHVLQSLMMFAAVFAVQIVLSITAVVTGLLPLIGGLLAGLQMLIVCLAWLAWGGSSIWLAIGAYKGDMKELPYIGRFAKELANNC